MVNLIQNIKSNRFESEKLLTHPLLQSFIMYKWRKINWMFNIQFLLTFLFVFVFSIFTTMKCGQETNSIAETIYFVPFLVPFLVEILVFEVFLIWNIQFHYNYVQNFFKIAVFALGKKGIIIKLYSSNNFTFSYSPLEHCSSHVLWRRRIFRSRCKKNLML